MDVIEKFLREHSNTISSLRGRIAKMEKAIAGLEACL